MKQEESELPTRPGRRLLRMLLRSDVKTSDSVRDCRAEGERYSTVDAEDIDKPTTNEEKIDKPALPTNNDDKMDAPAPAPVPVSKFASLKRKLFPSQNRRYPRNVPPLISPINTPVNTSLSPLVENGKSLSRKSTYRGEHDNNDKNQVDSSTCRDDVKQPKFDSREDSPESDFSAELGDNWMVPGNRTFVDDDDDRDLENAVEALDFENSAADKTLEEMSKTIDALRAWKESHEKETLAALNKLQVEQELQPQTIGTTQELSKWEDTLETQLELKMQQQQRDREAQTLELLKETEAYQLECSLFRTTLDESEVVRVDRALQGRTDSEEAALSRLRNELFQLDVKQRQEAFLEELQGAESALDMNIIHVQAFTGELDAILARFVNVDESTNGDLII